MFGGGGGRGISLKKFSTSDFFFLFFFWKYSYKMLRIVERKSNHTTCFEIDEKQKREKKMIDLHLKSKNIPNGEFKRIFGGRRKERKKFSFFIFSPRLLLLLSRWQWYGHLRFVSSWNTGQQRKHQTGTKCLLLLACLIYWILSRKKFLTGKQISFRVLPVFRSLVMFQMEQFLFRFVCSASVCCSWKIFSQLVVYHDHHHH